MSALAQLPPKYASIPSVRSLASRVDSLSLRNRALKQEGGASTASMVETSAATFGGAALAGLALGKGWSDVSVGVMGGAAAAIGVFTGQKALLHVANGILCPLITSAVAQQVAAQPIQQAPARPQAVR
jgi:hypothetical protein